MSALMTEETPGLRMDECAAYIAAVESALRIETPMQFLQWTQAELRTFFPHEILICGVGQIDNNSIQIRHVISRNFPAAYVRGLRRPDGGVTSPILALWCREGKPQLFEPEGAQMETAPGWLALFRQYQLHNIAAHGMRDLNSNVASYFSFSRIPGKLTRHHAHLLELLVPPMHGALVRALANSKPARQKPTAASPAISAREKEILHWLREGKTNWEIAQSEGRSALTVKNQVRTILIKLRVNNRAQAVGKAISLKIIRAKLMLPFGWLCGLIPQVLERVDVEAIAGLGIF